MKICFPIVKNDGLKSEVNGHFGSTKDFLIYDTDNSSFDIKTNKDAGHVHGMCQPLKALDGVKVDVVVVGGIGAGALMKLNAIGIKVLRAGQATVEENLSSHSNGMLEEIQVNGACAGHGNDGCGHS